jgi:hypothetical protein
MFEIGDKVVCVDDSPHKALRIQRLKAGTLYVIREVHLPTHQEPDTSVGLVGVRMPPHPHRGEYTWLTHRFRKLSDMQAEARERRKERQPA